MEKMPNMENMDDNTNIERIKEKLVEAYNKTAQEYGIARNEKFDAFLEQELKHFIDSVKQIGTRVIDVGSGSGNESMRFKEAGLDPVCVDISPAMVEECKKKGLDAHVMDFYRLNFPDESFAGSWMSFSLLHVPKSESESVIKEINRILVKNGIYYVSLFEGEGEGFRKEDVKKFGAERYFSYYKQDELERILLPYFEIAKTERLDISPRPTISFECVKKISS
ncbi:MAG: hypothetical protein A3B74_03510 [Candidatus Kerfeldbacteria bacterium RIFCSPHIGHO2_02_FULL_42_14]|uniref:Methyltransferase type 11 domain-containing protein n=1 Tax=Candidatus Kerfeldbacteria bacterium RIFCSPHIGHO2_02_FULL_42_14 TaxID=1798540 RepID=A0A1G2APV6_9BACT|nr:MAG: hypothetical protein A3B74_03510 [Candidatus Kerfeldbacteria bacterium RIFCSPHIGHO2_02_FULL_42_14]OGY80583.1 MAG: hypothetical protein A3E60_04000 [Candidatus Kerfeldbacteria bacterium RIFCSPHIGHO2_12_FULL_42_13]OGY87569.1 MAG: hypothetical protein A3G01_00930 [Candidatus Kerfeldbacteria bacterium RIFCSPLOWO2_12_FULL_43_9]